MNQSTGPKLFGRRKGRALRKRQGKLMAEQLAGHSLDLATIGDGDPRKAFPVEIDRIFLEIGFGAGEHLVRQADANPRNGIIGCEVFVNGVARALVQIVDGARHNVLLHHGDATDLIAALPAACVERVFLLYPDPWPKRRHWKRRFINRTMVRALARILVPGGDFRFATDIASYADWTLRMATAEAAFEWTAERADDWRRPWPDWQPTRYEQKAVKAGRVPTYLTFRRR